MKKEVTFEELIDLEINIKRPLKLWGDEYPIIPIYLMDKIYGDGQQLIYVGTKLQRPYYWLIRVDSKEEMGSDEFYDKIESILEELYDELCYKEGRMCEHDLLSEEEWLELKGDESPEFDDYQFDSYKEYLDYNQYPKMKEEWGGYHWGTIANNVTKEIDYVSEAKHFKLK